MFPNPILQQIFAYLPLPDRLRASRVSRRWYYNCNDPHLYQDVVLKDLEFNTLLLAMQRIVQIGPRIRSITIEGCFSDFIQNTVVPVQFSNQPPNRPLLFSHIRALQPARRRQEYLKNGFELHNHFSDIFSQLMELGHSTLHTIKILNCDLDFEMTELFCAIACNANSLSTFHYVNNGDKGLHSSGLLQAIVSGSPKMRHFRGLHAGMNDAVLMTMARHWPLLESLTLCSIKSKDVLELTGLISEDGHELRGASPTGTISSRAFWELLCKCKNLRTLEVHDLACVTNRDLALYNSLRDALKDQRSKSARENNKRRFRPYDTHYLKHSYHHHHHNQHNKRHLCYHQQQQQLDTSKFDLPGSSLRNLRVTKFITTPLSTPGFHDIAKLFPNLDRFEYATNFYTFNNQFEGVTPEMYEAERAAVAGFMATQKSLVYDGQWNEPITTEQRLMAGMTTRSNEQ
ncbi:unnamed protein product [Mucor circinelloides]|uniref:F-box domain-containing protein n=1 Tax=Mucor circinelloides f. circinelloides (strain 1006PhL) TaxID=1220926 RepID=S2J8Q4_MUCC1|nr:hypothetical protein HMPREF1544_08430 [Mucor circinelloides 1006PhL]